MASKYSNAKEDTKNGANGTNGSDSGQKCGSSNSKKGKYRDSRNSRKGKRSNGTANNSAVGSNMTSYPKSSMSNDFEWYNKNPSLTLGVGQIPYPNRPGMELELGTWAFNTTDKTIFVPHHSIPGFMALRYVPTLGSAHDYQDAVNVAAREIYARVRDAYSGLLSVSAADLMMYVGAIDSIYSEISHLRRIYGILNSYTSENYNFPDGALRAMGLTDEQVRALRQDKMQLYTSINMLISRVRKYKLPSVMDLFKRHWWMAENIFADAPSLRSQMFFFHPDGAWKIGFNEQGTSLSYVSRNEAGMSIGVDGLTKLATDLMDSLDASEDAYTMNGYLQRAFADVPAFTVEDMDINYQLAPQYNPEVLLQIMNSTIASGKFLNTEQWKYTQDVSHQLINDDIVVTLGSDCLSTTCVPNFLLRQDVDNPMVGDTVIATRMMAVVDYSRVGQQPNTYHMSFGTEFPLAYRLSNWSPWKQAYESRDVYESFLTQNTDMIFSLIDTWNKFNHAPILYVLETTASGDVKGLHLIGDYYNPTTVDQGVLDQLHSVCALSELNAFGIYTK